MEAAELREMSDEQLQITLNDACESLFRLRWQAQTERLDAPSELRKNRRLIARVKTVQREREMDGALNVQARFVDPSGYPLGAEYRASVVGAEGVSGGILGHIELDHNGRAVIRCDLKEEKTKPIAEKLIGGKLFVVLEKEDKEVFRSRGFKAVAGRHIRSGLNLGTMKV